MREILFRGKRVDNGEWVYGAFCGQSSESIFGKSQESSNIIKYGDPFDGHWFDIDPASVGQYTGLTDKDGTRIFEGDIVVSPNRTRPMVIRWNDGCFEIALNHFYVICRLGERQICVGKLRVVGNIHDNPELLEVK